MAGISLAYLVENVLTAIIVISYLAYEIRWGRVSRMVDRLDGVIDVVMLLVYDSDFVDEESAEEHMNGNSIYDLIESDYIDKEDWDNAD